MAWFRDKTTKAKEYIQDTENVSRPMAVLFTIIIFFIGVAVVFCLFLGGKWVYQQFTGKNGTTQIESGEQTSQTSSSQQQAKSPQSQPTNQPTGLGNQTTNTSNQNQTQQAASTPSTGPSEVPNTGPSPE
jgi:predicted PurR-regulated permease PerM